MRGVKQLEARPDWAQDVIAGFADVEAWARETLSIREKSGRSIPFIYQPAQKRLREAIARCRKLRKPVRIIVLKARQVMISSGTAAEVFHEVPFKPGQHALVVAHEQDNADLIFDYYHQFAHNYAGFRGIELDALIKDAKEEGAIEWANKSWIHTGTAKNVKIGRGGSIRFLHLSEYAFWRDAKTLMTGLMQSVPNDPDTIVVIESTANGVGGDFYERWQEANDPTANSEWIPIFFAWWEHPEYTIAPEDPVSFERSLSKEECDLRDRYNLTLGQLCWRRWCIKANCKNSLDTFHQEYPSCPEEAFLFSGRPRFSHQHLARMPVDRDGVVGELETWMNGPKPVLKFVPKERGALIVYRKPAERHRYAIGVDTAEGKDLSLALGNPDPDWSVATVVDMDSGEEVAQLRGRIEPAPFGEYVAVLGQYYNWAFLVVETTGPGLATMEELLRQQYPVGQLYHRIPDAEDRFAPDQSATLSRLGWKTSVVSREILMSKLDQAIRELSIVMHNPGTIDECRTFVRKPNSRAEAMDGCHDDRVFAIALAVIGIEQAPPDRRMSPINQMRQPPGKPSQTVTTYGRRRLPERGELVRF